jgi:hypothetical protein
MIYLIQLKRPTLFEQTAVAETLSGMKGEVNALEAKLSKARDRSCRKDGRSRRG